MMVPNPWIWTPSGSILDTNREASWHGISHDAHVMHYVCIVGPHRPCDIHHHPLVDYGCGEVEYTCIFRVQTHDILGHPDRISGLEVPNPWIWTPFERRSSLPGTVSHPIWRATCTRGIRNALRMYRVGWGMGTDAPSSTSGLWMRIGVTGGPSSGPDPTDLDHQIDHPDEHLTSRSVI